MTHSFTIPGLKKISGTAWQRYFKRIVLVLSYSFLMYKLSTFPHYDAFIRQFIHFDFTRFIWLGAVFILCPINWLLESLKWKMLMSKLQYFSILKSMQSVFTGIATGFFTPNRVGEFAGRIAFVNPEFRKAGVTLSFMNSLTQNMTMIFFGIPAFLFFLGLRHTSFSMNSEIYLIVMVLMGIFFALLYFEFPLLIPYLERKITYRPVLDFLLFLVGYSRIELSKVLIISALRYIVFCLQFYFMLRFWSVGLTIFQAAITIPTSYLFVSFTPAFSFSEPAVRSSYAVMFIGAFGGNQVAILFAALAIWVINFAIPMILGSWIWMRKSD